MINALNEEYLTKKMPSDSTVSGMFFKGGLGPRVRGTSGWIPVLTTENLGCLILGRGLTRPLQVPVNLLFLLRFFTGWRESV